jgi:hypothetical protein
MQEEFSHEEELARTRDVPLDAPQGPPYYDEYTGEKIDDLLAE